MKIWFHVNGVNNFFHHFVQFSYQFLVILIYIFRTIFFKPKSIRLHVIIILRTRFRVNPHAIVCLNVKEHLARSRRHFWNSNDSNQIQTLNHFVRKRTLNHLAIWLNGWVFVYELSGCRFESRCCHLKSIRFKKIPEIKLLDQNIVSKKRWKRNEGKPWSQQLPAIAIFPDGWNKQTLALS